jgi:hypothetical protein
LAGAAGHNGAMLATFDDIRDRREEWEATLPHDEYRQRMLTEVEQMAMGEPGRAELLECLSSDLAGEDAERSLELARAAVDDGGPTTVDARVAVVRALYAVGRGDEASVLVRKLLRARSRDDVTVGLHTTLGEVLEMEDQLSDAQRAYTVALREFDPEVDEPTLDEDMCLAGRYRVRRALGAGRDAYDRFLEEFAPTAAEAIRERATSASTP